MGIITMDKISSCVIKRFCLLRSIWGVNGQEPTEVTIKEVEFMADYFERIIESDYSSSFFKRPKGERLVFFNRDLIDDISIIKDFTHFTNYQEGYEKLFKHEYGTLDGFRFVVCDKEERTLMRTRDKKRIYRLEFLSIPDDKSLKAFLEDGTINDKIITATLLATKYYEE